MRGPYGFEPIGSCRTSNLKLGGFFSQLSTAALKDFDAIKSMSAQPAGAILFLERQEPRGVFVLFEGQVKLSISSSEGKTLILRIAKAGEILGLMPTLSSTPYEATAETLHPCQAGFVHREDFLRFIAKHPEAFQNVLRQVAANYQTACEQIRSLGLSASAPERLAKLLLEWCADGQETKQGTQVKMPLTHEEIGEFIGTSRETVTRTLTEFKSRHLLTLHGSNLMISNREGLESFVSA